MVGRFWAQPSRVNFTALLTSAWLNTVNNRALRLWQDPLRRLNNKHEHPTAHGSRKFVNRLSGGLD